ncbi:neuroguidin-A-like [Physella acuta]|uniref:neuroguidin-A-like n=1 Tax=Physella acuta TaxID=109671 RepID=UPI0027DD0540|nr:neuroguidin-A-like [Physella acuta]
MLSKQMKHLNMNENIDKDLPEAFSVLREIKKSSGECLLLVRGLIGKIKSNGISDGSSHLQGISFLDLKNQLMASYMANLGLLMDKKTSGKSVQHDPSIDRLIEIRTVLEKMRPIEHKLKYQINKVITAYKECKLDPSDPRKFRPNFGAFTNMPEEADSDAAEEQEKVEKPKLYVAPKMAPVHYSDDETMEEREKKMVEKKTKRALSSAMIREMREQYTDAPIEIVESHDLHRILENRKMKEKTEYEEDNFVRLTVSKKEMAGRRKLGTMSALGALADFDDFGEGETMDGSSKKKRKISQKKHKGKKGNNKRRRR